MFYLIPSSEFLQLFSLFGTKMRFFSLFCVLKIHFSPKVFWKSVNSGWNTQTVQRETEKKAWEGNEKTEERRVKIRLLTWKLLFSRFVVTLTQKAH